MPAKMHLYWTRETWGSEIYFTYYILTGRKTPVPSDTGSARLCGSSGAPGSPNLFHLSHSDWTRDSRPLLTPEAAGSANRVWHISRQIYFTYHALTGRKTFVPSDTGNDKAMPIVRRTSVVRFISPITF